MNQHLQIYPSRKALLNQRADPNIRNLCDHIRIATSSKYSKHQQRSYRLRDSAIEKLALEQPQIF